MSNNRGGTGRRNLSKKEAVEFSWAGVNASSIAYAHGALPQNKRCLAIMAQVAFD
jgi:hypothetical protein